MMQHGGEGSAVDLLKATTEGIVAFITLLTGLEEFLQGTNRALTSLKLTGEAIENGLDGDGVIVVCKVDIRDDVRGVGAETGLQVRFHLSCGPILGASDVLEVTGMLHPSLWGGIRHGFEGNPFSTPSPLIALDSIERFEQPDDVFLSEAKRGLWVIGPLAGWLPSFISPRRASAPLAHIGRGSRTGAPTLRGTSKQVRVDVVNVRPRAAPLLLALLVGPGGVACPTPLTLAVGTERDVIRVEGHGVQVQLLQQSPALNLPCG